MTKRLLEMNRNQLINKSKKSDPYKDQSKGKNRWERRKYSKVSSTTQSFNNVNMNTFFKQDILTLNVPVQGETSDYMVIIKFSGILDEIQKEVKSNNNKLSYKAVVRALVRVFNNRDVLVHCSCDDWKYRMDYWATVGDYNSGPPQLSNGKAIVNPNNTKGAGCKHVNLVISNVAWMYRIGSVINNYITYMRKTRENLYADWVFPKIYGVPYKKAIQLSLFTYDGDELVTGEVEGQDLPVSTITPSRTKKTNTTKQNKEDNVFINTTPKQLSIFDDESSVEENS